MCNSVKGNLQAFKERLIWYFKAVRVSLMEEGAKDRNTPKALVGVRARPRCQVKLSHDGKRHAVWLGDGLKLVVLPENSRLLRRLAR